MHSDLMAEQWIRAPARHGKPENRRNSFGARSDPHDRRPRSPPVPPSEMIRLLEAFLLI